MKNTTYSHNLSWLAISVEDGEISPEDFEIAKDFEFGINGEDIGLFLAQAKELMDIRNIKSVHYSTKDFPNFHGAYKVVLKNDTEILYGFKCGYFGLELIK